MCKELLIQNRFNTLYIVQKAWKKENTNETVMSEVSRSQAYGGSNFTGNRTIRICKGRKRDD